MLFAFFLMGFTIGITLNVLVKLYLARKKVVVPESQTAKPMNVTVTCLDVDGWVIGSVVVPVSVRFGKGYPLCPVSIRVDRSGTAASATVYIPELDMSVALHIPDGPVDVKRGNYISLKLLDASIWSALDTASEDGN